MMAVTAAESNGTQPRGRASSARILVATSGLAGILYSSVELARRLAADGHLITYASSAHARDLVEATGLGFLELDPNRYSQFLESDSRKPFIRRLARLGARRRQAVASTGVESFVGSVERIRPDLLLMDGEMHEHIIAASSTGVPTAVMNTFCSIWRHPGLPPPHCFAQPGIGWQGTRVGSALLWSALGVRRRHRAWMQKIRRVGCDRMSLLGQLADSAAVSLRSETDDRQWLMPFTYRNRPALSLHALEFEFDHRPLRHVHYVGPMVLQARTDAAMEPAERDEFEEVLARLHGRPEGRKLIYAGFGSVLSAKRELLELLVRTVAERPDWHLVISLSRRLRPADLGPLPDRAHAFSWVPQTRILRLADVVVTHGGINTIDESVMQGVPLLIYNGGETDMAGNAARVVYHGLGIAGDGRRDGVGDIARHIERLVGEPSFVHNVEAMRRSYRAYSENRVAESTVRMLLGEAHAGSGSRTTETRA